MTNALSLRRAVRGQPEPPPLRHPRAEQGAQRRGADPRIHAATSKRCHGPDSCSAALYVNIPAWIPGSPRRRFAAAPPGDDDVGEASANSPRATKKARSRLLSCYCHAIVRKTWH